MLTKLTLKNWKSFEYAELYIDPLTVLIGTNAGGKSNALDALEFLNRSANGLHLTTCLSGDANMDPLRGGTEWAVRDHGDAFSLGASVRADETTLYEYRLEVHISEGRAEVVYEELIRKKLRTSRSSEPKVAGEIKLFSTDQPGPDDPTLKARLYNKKGGSLRQLSRASSALSQLSVQSTRQEIGDGVEAVGKALRGIFILDPIPSHMREYSPLSELLEPDAGNIAGVIAALPDERRKIVESTFAKYLAKLPEKDIRNVYSERVGKFQSDAMLYCEERWSAADFTYDSRRPWNV